MATRSENDFKPNNMSSRRTESASTRQLDFYQAMSDFKHMFPTLDEEIIEAVLRANNGAVDATIDQLLTMNIDNEEEEDSADMAAPLPVKIRPFPREKAREISHTRSKSLSNEDPPSYSEAIKNQRGSKSSSASPSQGSVTKKKSSKGPNLLDLDIGTFASTLATVSSETTPKTLLEESLTENGHTPRRKPRTWHPPLLGKLPDDFLRLKPETSSHRSSRPLGRSQSMPAQPKPNVRQITVHHELSSNLLQKKLRENERRRRSTPSRADPEMTQYLEDERMAIILQNSEFLEELRQNEDFMKTLERDRMNASAFEPANVTPPTVRRHKESPSTSSTSKEMAPLPPIPDDKIEQFQEGYGKDKQDTLEAFPFTQKLNNGDDDADKELRRQLKHMGKASRRQFADLARRFFSRRKKKTARQLLRDSHAPSTINLLEEEEDDHLIDVNQSEDVRRYDGEFTSGSQMTVVPGYKTVQRPLYNPDMTVRHFDAKPTDMV